MTDNRIAEARAEAGLTQQEVADAVGAHWITISKLERGRIKLNVDWMNKLAPVLGVKPADLMAANPATPAHTPNYRFKCQIVDETTGIIIGADFCGLTTIDEFGGCESVDMHVASMLRAFQRTGRAEHERANYEPETTEG